MLSGLKGKLRTLLASWPGVSRLFYKWHRYRGPMDEKAIRSHIQHVAHAVDLRLSTGQSVAPALVRELEFLFGEAGRKAIATDEPMRWALQQYVVARHGLRPEMKVPARADPAAAASAWAEDVLAQVIKQRRSVRRWTAEPVDPQDIRDAIEVARWAPCSCNRQLWQTLLIRRPEDVEFVSRYFAHKFFREAPLLILVMMNAEVYGPSERHFAYLDGAAFIQNLLLMLHAKGYGTCWVGFVSWDCSGHVTVAPELYEEFYRYFRLKKGVVPISMIAVGRPAMVPQAPPRQGLENIIVPADPQERADG